MQNRIRYLATILLTILISVSTAAQAPERMTSGEIFNAIQKLRVLGSALYIAAHPDDENTRLISYLSNERKAHTTYLSLTRGDGGQNLVGPEIRELLGVIRTQELLMARQLDGGHQRFTRANDFGYSKTPEETLEFWNKGEVLSDVVWTIRTLQPDVIINRFPHDSYGGHGHHTASAMLSHEAFDLAAKEDVFPSQLAYVDPWQPRRLFFNTSWWFYGSREAFEEADKSTMMEVDVGNYYPMLGYSNTEIAAMSRSMHKSQGFGSSGTRGRQPEYINLLKGDMPDGDDIFADIDITWNRINAGHIDELLELVESSFDHENPASSVPALTAIRAEINNLDESIWKTRKLNEIDMIIEQCLGLFIEVAAADYWAAPGDSVDLRIEITNRLVPSIQLVAADFHGTQISGPQECTINSPVIIEQRIKLSDDLSYSSPYWLKEQWSEGMYEVEDQLMRGLPENPRDLGVSFTFNFEDGEISWFKPVVYKETDPVKGEVYRPFEILPKAFVNISETVIVFADPVEKPVMVKVKANTDNVNGDLRIEVPEGWTVTPESVNITLSGKGDEQDVTFALIPPEEQQTGHIQAILETPEFIADQSVTEITYDHIPSQTILSPAHAKVVKVDLKRAGNHIGYIMGAGDEIPASLTQVGYDVDLLDEDQVTSNSLSKYDAIILGVRAYNTSERLRYIQDALFDYVERGGTLVTQYNTSRRLKANELAPYPLTISRTRVTDETADVELIMPEHRVLNFPNEITSKDFEDWVQERGLYFAEEWHDEYDTILRMNDPGEEPSEGSLLVTKHGDGYFIYTSLSWFRQLPAGIPGAYRMFVNLISQGSPSRS